MEIRHRFVVDLSPETAEQLKTLGLKFDFGIDPRTVVNVPESSSHWEEITGLIFECDPSPIHQVENVFTKSEMKNADFHKIWAIWRCGYPQPEDIDWYREATYDLSAEEKEFGTGAIQNAPFRMKKSPKWGRRSLTELFWAEDAIFIKPDIWKEHFAPLGIKSMPVLNKAGTKEIEDVVQLLPQGTANSLLDKTRLELREGGKYMFGMRARGYFPKFTGEEPLDFFEAQEWFGSGPAADRKLFMSKRLYHIIQDNGLKGLGFHPLEHLDKYH